MHLYFQVTLCLIFFPLILTRIIDSADRKKVSDFIMPISHVEIINGEYVTFRDREINEPTDREKACLEPEESIKKVKTGPLNADSSVTEKPFVFNDTTPFNGTEVEEELFRKEEFKPTC